MKAKKVFDGQRGLILAIFTASVFVNILILTAPLYMLQLFSRVLSSGSTATLVMLTVGAVIALLFFFFFDALRQRLVSRLGTRLEARLGPIVLTGLMSGNLPDEICNKQPLADLQRLRGFVTSPVLIALLDAPWSVVFVAMIFLFHPLMGLVALTGLTALFVLALANEAGGRKVTAAADDAAIEANGTAEEMLTNAEVAHAMGGTRALIERHTYRSFAAIVFGTLATDRTALMTSMAKFLRMGLQIAIMGTGVALVLKGAMTPGLMIAASILLGRAAAPVEQSIAGWGALLKARGALSRLNLLMAHLDTTPERMELPTPEGRIEVEGATVLLPGHQAPVLFDVSFRLDPGQSLGLIGPSGAGKTTLARCLVGLQPLVRGVVRIDDAALTDWPTEQIGRHIGFLPQRVDLFAGTVAENIAMMDPEARPSEVVAAARLAGVHELILRLPGGYNHELGKLGSGLSAGQRQRVGLARAFFGERRLVVLDEPNANLDPEGEAALAQAIATATARGTVVVVITHRMNLLREVSHAALLEDGRLRKFGAAQAVLDSLPAPAAASAKDGKVTLLQQAKQSKAAAAVDEQEGKRA